MPSICETKATRTSLEAPVAAPELVLEDDGVVEHPARSRTAAVKTPDAARMRLFTIFLLSICRFG